MPMKGPGTGRSIVDMCLACARSRVFQVHVACFSRHACSLRVSDFPFQHDLSRAMEIFHWLFLPTDRGS